MSDPAACGCDDRCQESLPVFLEGGDERSVELRELTFGLLLRDPSFRPSPVELVTRRPVSRRVAL